MALPDLAQLALIESLSSAFDFLLHDVKGLYIRRGIGAMGHTKLHSKGAFSLRMSTHTWGTSSESNISVYNAGVHS